MTKGPIDRPDSMEVQRLKKAEIKGCIKRLYLGCPVCLCEIDDSQEEHLGTIAAFGFVIRKSQCGRGLLLKKFVALTSNGWYLVEDLIYCPLPEEQVQLREKIRAKNKLCTIAEWQAMIGCKA